MTDPEDAKTSSKTGACLKTYLRNDIQSEHKCIVKGNIRISQDTEKCSCSS